MERNELCCNLRARGPDVAHGLGRTAGEQLTAGVCLQGSQGLQEKPELPLL